MTRRLLALGALGALAVGALLHVLGRAGLGNAVWAASTAAILLPLCWSVAMTLWRRDVGVDAIALVAIVSALALGQYLAVLDQQEAGDALMRQEVVERIALLVESILDPWRGCGGGKRPDFDQ